MAKEYTVTRAFIATLEDKKTPEVINTKGGPMHKYIFQVEEYPDWLNILKKVEEDGTSKPLTVGATVYGDISENNYGKMQFQRAQRPFQQGQAPQQAAARPQNQPQSVAHQGNNQVTLQQVLDEVKYVRGLLENQFRSQAGNAPAQSPTDSVPTDIDDGPVDLSQIDY